MQRNILAVALGAAVLATGLSAQNRIERNNDNIFSFGFNYNGLSNCIGHASELYTPRCYFFAQGVPADSDTWVWIPHQVNHRPGPGGENRRVNGLHIALKPSVNTNVFPAPAYLPEMEIRVPTNMPYNGRTAMVPNYNVAPLFTIGQSAASFTLSSPMLASRTFATQTLTQQDMVITARWNGGERCSTPASGSTLSQVIMGTHYEAYFPVPTFGYFFSQLCTNHGGPGLRRDNGLSIARPYMGYMEEEAMIQIASDYGQMYQPNAPGRGRSVSSGSMLASLRASQLELQVEAGVPNAFQLAVPLMNFRAAPNAISTSFLNETLELDPNDVFLFSLLNVFGAITLDANGSGATPVIPVPLDPSLVGNFFGFEFYIIDSAANARESTGAYWVECF